MRATLKRCLQLMVILALLSVVSPVQAFYNPSTGKWLNRDPIGERGGINSMAFVKNDLINIVDFLGLDTAVKKCTIEIHVGHHRGADPHIPTDLKKRALFSSFCHRM